MGQKTTPRPPAPRARRAPLLRMAFEGFLAREDEHQFAEWVDGQVILLTTTSEHQLFCKFLLKVLDSFIEANDLGELLPAPFAMRASAGGNAREPDLLFIARERLHLIRANWLDGPADLVVEVVSPDGRTRDRRTKFREYAEGGVREYWMVDFERRQAEFYSLTDGVYVPLPIGEDGIVHSMVLEGFWLDTEWLWQRPFPTLAAVQEAWAAPAVAATEELS